MNRKSWKLLWRTQELHCCGAEELDDERDGSIRARVEDGGGGPYVVISAHEWAIDSVTELDALWAELRELVQQAENEAQDQNTGPA